MAKGDRTGNRKTREQRKLRKVPELGYYLIVTDTEGTERCFFAGLHQSLPEEVRNKLVIKVVETKTRSMSDKCLELTAYEAQYRIPWIVFDRDQVIGFDEMILSILVYTFFTRMFDFMLPLVVKYSIVAA